jgi:hypothetical protein
VVTKDQCVDANGQGQHLRADGKLSAAREQLRTCANPACPAMVRSDCTKRLDDLESAQPTIAFEVKDASGADVVAVKVTVDGKPLADRLDGTPLAVDPGEHVFGFDIEGQSPVTRTLVLTEGVKGRRERVVVGPGAPVPAATAALPATPSAAESASASEGGGLGTGRLLGLVAGGVGVAGLAVGGIFGALTLSERSQQESACGSPCSSSSHTQALGDHSTGMTDATISTVGFIAGGALVLGGAVLFFTARPSPQPQPTTGVLVLPGVGPGGGGVLLKGAF